MATTDDLLIVDAQIHIWGANTPERPWPVGRPAKVQRPVPFSRDDALRDMDEAGVARAVIVPPSWEGDYNDLGLAAAAAHPDRFAVMGRLDLSDRSSPEKLAHWRQAPGMLGIRLTFRSEEELAMLADPNHWTWVGAEKHGVPLYLYPVGLVKQVGAIAERHPGLKFTFDHMALQREKGPAAFADLADLLALAKLPNVAVKASALPVFSAEPYPFADVHGFLRQTFDAFGPKRTFWGTDLTRLPCPYRQAITMFTEHLPWLKGEDLAQVMGRAVCDWLGWKI